MPRPINTNGMTYTELYNVHVQEAYEGEQKVYELRDKARAYLRRTNPNAGDDWINKEADKVAYVADAIAGNKWAREKAALYAPGMQAEQDERNAQLLPSRRYILQPPRLPK